MKQPKAGLIPLTYDASRALERDRHLLSNSNASSVQTTRQAPKPIAGEISRLRSQRGGSEAEAPIMLTQNLRELQAWYVGGAIRMLAAVGLLMASKPMW